MASPDLRNGPWGPKAGNDPAIFISWRRYFDMRSERRKREWDGKTVTDYQRRPIEVLVVEVTVKTQSVNVSNPDFVGLQAETTYTAIEVQSPDADNVVAYGPIAGKWYIDNITAVEIAPDVAKLQLTVKTWGTWATVT